MRGCHVPNYRILLISKLKTMEKVIVAIFLIVTLGGCRTKQKCEKIMQEEYEQGYTKGKSDGYSAGLSTGRERGKIEGQHIGELVGFGKGRRQGLEEGRIKAENDPLYKKRLRLEWLKGEKAGLIQSDSIGYKRGYEKGLDDGRNWAFKETVISTLKTTAPQATGLGLALFCFALWFYVPYRLWYPTWKQRFLEYFQDRQWSVQSKFSRRKKIEVEKKRWGHEAFRVKRKLITLKAYLVKLENRGLHCQEFLGQQISDQSRQQAQKDIQNLETEKTRIEHQIIDASKIQLKIEEIQNELDYRKWKVENGFDDEFNWPDWTDIQCEIGHFMKFRYA